MQKMIKPDGNGNLVIPGWFLAVIAIGITVLSSMASVVAMGTTLRNDVDTLKNEWDQAGPIHTQTIKEIESRVTQCELTDATIVVKLENIEKKIDQLDYKIEQLQGATK